MITQLVFGWVASFFTWVIGVLPAPSVPSWVSTVTGGIHTVMGDVASMSTWIPVGLVLSALGFLVAIYGVAWSIRVIRWIQSSLTFGGGS